MNSRQADARLLEAHRAFVAAAQHLRAVREALDLSQPEMARRLGVSVWSLRNWEQMRHPIPKLLPLALWAVEHGADASDIAM